MINRFISIGLILPILITIIEKTFSTRKVTKTIDINKLNKHWVFCK